MTQTCWAIRHVAFEDLGTLAAPLQAAGYAIRYLEAGIDDPAQLDGADDRDLLVVLGGPIGAYETDSYPWLHAEIAAIGRWLRAGRPTLGICLGSQLMAAALGARVYPGHEKEIGWYPLTATAAGAAAGIAALTTPHTTMLHWHGDTFDLPEGATLLASSAAYPHQVYSWGERALAFQCHPEFDAQRQEQWMIGHAGELAGQGIDLAGLRALGVEHGAQLKRQTQVWLAQWLAQLTPGQRA
ncbi:GMP synthase (glutamine-hydrolysing) [Andreprevotia lacus DSM 23236]|uniref:GMP synthase (Glutamine-hydrolysing) n=1 Tax=Andreprevotia lacus DSM 23236 TaxID=1121001 RepID=A0A1W1XNN4_9NEIS|nr:glutamine amidotransferase [Andreprevotia lacus]SMC25472.1 GMP synthase (glutamine-hydrolysing) [Andreprevotia lacus DSM 23236]